MKNKVSSTNFSVSKNQANPYGIKLLIGKITESYILEDNNI
jgi:hypothetical protein